MDQSIRDQDQSTSSPEPAPSPARHGSSRRWRRRSFLWHGLTAAGATAAGAKLLGAPREALAHGPNGRLLPGDAAILRFLAAAELIETDLWQQYNEIYGIQDGEVPGGSGNAAYTAALVNLDQDMPQYVHDNTDDEISHEQFLNGYLMAHGAAPANLDPFRRLPSSQAPGAQQIGRLTNLMELTIDTTWWGRYRDSVHNPDLDPAFMFAPAVPGLMAGRFPAIPRGMADMGPDNHVQAIANTAAFHFASIEIGGTSLYPQLAQRVTHPQVLRVVLSIGPTEAMHFQTWQDKAGNAIPVTDPTNGLTFTDLSGPESVKANLIMPEPCPFLSRDLPPCSIVRPTETRRAATLFLGALVSMGLFRNQSPGFFRYMETLAAQADAAQRGFVRLDDD